MAEDQNPPADEQDKNNNERKRPGKKPLIILGIVVVVMVVVALVWWFLTRNEETTDDAFTDGDVVTIAPKTAGYVTELRVRDNQRVKKGDLLVVIDPRDTTAQRDQAQGVIALFEHLIGLALFAAASEEDFEDTDDTGVLPADEVKTLKDELKEANAEWKAQLKTLKGAVGDLFSEIKVGGAFAQGHGQGAVVV